MALKSTARLDATVRAVPSKAEGIVFFTWTFVSCQIKCKGKDFFRHARAVTAHVPFPVLVS